MICCCLHSPSAARGINIIFNSLLVQLIKYDVHTTRKIKSIYAIFYHILLLSTNAAAEGDAGWSVFPSSAGLAVVSASALAAVFDSVRVLRWRREIGMRLLRRCRKDSRSDLRSDRRRGVAVSSVLYNTRVIRLVIRQSTRSSHQQRLLQMFTEDVFIFSLLMYIAH